MSYIKEAFGCAERGGGGGEGMKPPFRGDISLTFLGYTISVLGKARNGLNADVHVVGGVRKWALDVGEVIRLYRVLDCSLLGVLSPSLGCSLGTDILRLVCLKGCERALDGFLWPSSLVSAFAAVFCGLVVSGCILWMGVRVEALRGFDVMHRFVLLSRRLSSWR